MLQVHVAVLKEPRGFIKALQFVFAVLAFSTTVGFSTYFTFHASVEGCDTGPVLVRNNVNYPFALDSTVLKVQLCQSPPRDATFHFQTDTASAAKFFVAVGVISMLFSLAILVGYVLLDELYTSNRLLPSIDFALHATFCALWLVAASAWSDGAATLNTGCDPRTFLRTACRDMQDVTCDYLHQDYSGGFAKLNVSLIFGFLNVFLWGTNLWFVWKETPWYRPRPDAASPPAPVA